MARAHFIGVDVPPGYNGTSDMGTSDMREDADRFAALVDVMARLRGPDGCPWDREQTLETLKSYLIEEAYEVLEAMEGPRDHLREELGDLLLQIVFQAQLAGEEGSFDIAEVIEGIRAKLVHRHPHVFGTSQVASSEAVKDTWEQNKREDRRKRKGDASVLDGIPASLPALLQAWRLTDKASRVGFDWPSLDGVQEKLQEELGELSEALETGAQDPIAHELGDVLFSIVNLSRFLKVNPEEALRRANLRFTARFQHLERALHREGLRPEEVGLEELDRRWDAAKRALQEE